MEIITAKEARKMTDEYVPHDIRRTIEIVMKEIKDAAKYGNNSVEFNSNFSTSIDFEKLKTERFIEFIKNLEYKYDFYVKDCFGFYDETVKISW